LQHASVSVDGRSNPLPSLWAIGIVAALASTQSFFVTVTVVSLMNGDTITAITRDWVRWTTHSSMPRWMFWLTTPPAILGFLAGAALRMENGRPWLPLSVAAGIAAAIPALILAGFAAVRT
jgi:hypothetical protein